ncbi:MAG TPA: sigma-70 family RNA polymerase sigma factor [Pyrinomonadaceae bacterium]|jgi:RNA polymerase sigma factor (TIGR02999 family)
MEKQTSPDVTGLLLDFSRGNNLAFDELFPLVYEELRKIAKAHLKREHRGEEHTLQATALVHEAYLKMVNQKEAQWENRAHFFGIAAQVMRHILIDHARSRLREKRGGGDFKLSLDENINLSDEKSAELVSLDEALKIFAEIDPVKAKIVELRYFGGLSNEEIAAVLNIGTATVTRSWRTAKAWLQTQISGSNSAK